MSELTASRIVSLSPCMRRLHNMDRSRRDRRTRSTSRDQPHRPRADRNGLRKNGQHDADDAVQGGAELFQARAEKVMIAVFVVRSDRDDLESRVFQQFDQSRPGVENQMLRKLVTDPPI